MKLLKKKSSWLLASLLLLSVGADAKVKFDYSLVFVPEEGGVKFEKITDDADCVADYKATLWVRHLVSLAHARPVLLIGG